MHKMHRFLNLFFQMPISPVEPHGPVHQVCVDLLTDNSLLRLTARLSPLL